MDKGLEKLLSYWSGFNFTLSRL